MIDFNFFINKLKKESDMLSQTIFLYIFYFFYCLYVLLLVLAPGQYNMSAC